MAPFGHKGLKAYVSEGTNETPYNQNLKSFDELIGEQRRETRTWRFIAFFMAGIVLVAAGGLIYGYSLPRTVPYVIEVATWGEAKNIGVIGEIKEAAEAPEKVQRYYLARFIQDLRNYSSDQSVTVAGLQEAYYLVTQKGSELVSTMYRVEMPFKTMGNNRRNVHIETMLRMPNTANAWQVDWTENMADVAGHIYDSPRYRGIFTLLSGVPTEEQINANPLGVFVDDFQFQKIDSGVGK